MSEGKTKLRKKAAPPRDDVRCTAHRVGTGIRCTVPVIKGGTVCVYHGGSAPQVRAAANRHLQELVPDALRALSAIVNDTDEKSIGSRLSAAKDILDRAGTAATAKHEVDLHDSTDERTKAALEALEAIGDE